YGTPQTRIVRFMEWFGYSPFANMQDADISIKPPNWTGKKDEELDLVKGADLAGRDLRYANAQRAFLAKADLSASDLESADLRGADLRQAFFWHRPIQTDLANLQNDEPPHDRANLRKAHLENARLDAADLSHAILTDAKLFQADLSRADL